MENDFLKNLSAIQVMISCKSNYLCLCLYNLGLRYYKLFLRHFIE